MMTRQISRNAAALLAVMLLSLTGMAGAQEEATQQADSQEASANGDREQLAAEVEELKAMLREAKQALDDARQEAEHLRELAEEARSNAAKRERTAGNEATDNKKPTITERIEQAGLEHAARRASEFVSKQRQRLMSGGEQEEEEDEAGNKKLKRHKKDHGGERIVSVRLNLDILVVKRPEAKEARPAGRNEHHSHDQVE